MACKLECPSCKKILKEKDDHGKQAQGEYKVINSAVRQIECLECDFLRPVDVWTKYELGLVT
jgi:hypothetical protein